MESRSPQTKGSSSSAVPMEVEGAKNGGNGAAGSDANASGGTNSGAQNQNASAAKVVSKNLGIPIVFVLCNADLKPDIVECKRYQGWMELIQ